MTRRISSSPGVLFASLLSAFLLLPISDLALYATETEHILHGQVENITYGDVFTVKGDDGKLYVVHLRANDAPDTGQKYFNESKDALTKLIKKKTVDVHWTEKDHAGRVIGDVYVGEVLVNLHMIEDGWAWYYKEHLESDELQDAEQEAREAHRGLWAQESPQSPWDYRNSKKSAVVAVKKPSKTQIAPAHDEKPSAELEDDRDSSSNIPSVASGGSVHVKGHFRTLKSGKTVYVRPHTRRK